MSTDFYGGPIFWSNTSGDGISMYSSEQGTLQKSTLFGLTSFIHHSEHNGTVIGGSLTADLQPWIDDIITSQASSH